MIIGVDPGSVRVGVAIADTETRFARPLEVIDIREVDPVRRIAALVTENDVTRVVVGHPLHLSGEAGAAARAADELIVALEAALDIPVERFDERLTTVIADQGLRAGGGKAGGRRSIRDAIAAQVMLQGYMDAMS